METFVKAIGAFFLVLVIIAVVAFICAFPVMLLWNWLMPVIFGLTTINFWQALGLSLLSGMLFKNSSSNNSKSSD